MAMNVNNWYSDPAQRYNDVIYPQNGRRTNGKDWGRYDNKTASPPKFENDSEDKLSPTAKSFLEEMKKTYADKSISFVVAESNDSAEAQAKLAGSTSSKFTVLITNEELERMATDRQYCGDMLSKMYMGLNRASVYHEVDPNSLMPGETLRRSITYNSDGTTSMSAQVDKPNTPPQWPYHNAENPQYLRRAEQPKAHHKAEQTQKPRWAEQPQRSHRGELQRSRRPYDRDHYRRGPRPARGRR